MCSPRIGETGRRGIWVCSATILCVNPGLAAHLLSNNAHRVAGVRPKVIYTDLDGTMLGRGGSFIHDLTGVPTLEPAGAILAAQEAGIDVVPCSGRTLRGLIGDGRMFGMRTVVAEMGAVIAYDTGREIVRNLPGYPGGEMFPARYMDETGAVKLLLERYDGTLEHHMPWAAYRDYTQLFRGLVDPEEANARLAESGHDWLVLVDNGTLSADYMGLGEGRSHAYHLCPRGVSKGTAIALDQRRRSLAPNECVAIGDAVADLELAAECALLVLVHDAVERDPVLAERGLALPNVLVTDRPGNLGWADTLALLAGRR